MSASITARDSLLYMAADARPAQFFNGTLDDVRLYNRAQSQSEVQTDMNTALSTPVFDPTAPTVSITSPPNDAIVSGNRTITADAADDVGVAGRAVLRRRKPGGSGGHGCSLCGQLGHPRDRQRRAHADGACS